MIWHIPFQQNRQKAMSVPKCFFVKKTVPQGNAKWIYQKSHLYCLGGGKSIFTGNTEGTT